MIEVEKYCCKDVHQACKRERYFVEKLETTLNSNIPSRSNKEYIQDNRKKFQEFQKEYRKIKFICNSCNCEISLCHISHHNKTNKHIKHLNVQPDVHINNNKPNIQQMFDEIVKMKNSYENKTLDLQYQLQQLLNM
jgi:hypothetical protein